MIPMVQVKNDWLTTLQGTAKGQYLLLSKHSSLTTGTSWTLEYFDTLEARELRVEELRNTPQDEEEED